MSLLSAGSISLDSTFKLKEKLVQTGTGKEIIVLVLLWVCTMHPSYIVRHKIFWIFIIIFKKVNRSADMWSIAEIKTLNSITAYVLLTSPCQLKKLELSKPAKFVGRIYEGFTRRRMKEFCESITVLSSWKNKDKREFYSKSSTLY